MAKTKEQKKEVVDKIKDKLSRVKGGVVISFSGLSVNESNTLRKDLRKENIDCEVVKKTLLTKTIDQLGFKTPAFLKDIKNTVALALGYEDEVLAAKILDKFSKEKQGQMKLEGGIIEEKGEFRLLEREEVTALASLPGREELLAKLVGSVKAPASGLVNVLGGNMRGLINVLKSIKQE